MSQSEQAIRQSLSTVWKLAAERITPQLLNMPIIDARTALDTALAVIKGAGSGGAFGIWMTNNLNRGADVFTVWFDGIYRNAFREPAGNRSILCRQLQRLACGQLSRCGHRSLSDAHALLKQEGAGPWQIAWDDLKESGSANV